MARFSSGDLSTVQSFIDQSIATLWSKGLVFRIDGNIRKWAALLANQEQTHGVPRTHDPSHVCLTSANSFWSYLEEEDGRITACHAQRLIVSGDLLEDIRTQTIFGDACPQIGLPEMGLRKAADDIRIAGHIGLGGGLWIHPDRRGQDLYPLLSRLTRAIALRHFKLDWYCAFFLHNSKRTGLGLDGAAFAHTVPLSTGIYPPYGKPENIQFMFLDRHEILDQIRLDLSGITPWQVNLSGGIDEASDNADLIDHR